MSNSTVTNLVQRLSGHAPDALPVSIAQQAIQEFVEPIDGSETIALDDALGRVLAADVVSPIDVPAHDNSAMDGYAFCAGNADGGTTTLRIAGDAYAGHPFNGTVGAGECVRIMTGAVMPAGCDAVVPQELVQLQAGGVIAFAGDAVKAGDNRRPRGEDLAAGKAALEQGKMLRPADLGLLASLGIGRVSVRRRLRVAFFSTGDELRSIGETLDDGCVYDSNRHTVRGMLMRLGCEAIDLGVITDDPAALEAALRAGCEQADAIITSGGVSAGDADHTAQIMAQLGEVMFWKLAMRPGRPMAFGKIVSNGHGAYLFGLPGNPVAVMISFHFFVRDALLRLMGAAAKPLPLVRAVAQSAIRKKAGRTEYQRGILSIGADGRPQVRITGSQGSGILRSMSEANCIIVLSHDQDNVAAGDEVSVVLFDGLV
jgi:molybdopterin molybdotransferase